MTSSAEENTLRQESAAKQESTPAEEATLAQAKAQLLEKAGRLSPKEYMGKHPMGTLGAVFFAGLLSGTSTELQAVIGKAIVDMVGKEMFGQKD